jgi:hypothetical protein
MTPQRRIALMRALCRSSYSRSMRAISRAHPHADESEVKTLFVEINYGKPLADRYRRYLQRQRSAAAS